MARYRRTILGTCCIPWREDGALDEPIFRASIRALTRAGQRDLYIFGTAGEGYAVGEALFDRVTAIFVEEMQAADATPMVGVISLSLRTVQERIERAARLGVREFQFSLPSWGALNDRELAVYVAEVCDHFPECQFLHYNLARTRRLVTPAEYAALAARHPNLVATKNSTDEMGRISGLLGQAGELRHFLGDLGFLYGSLVGEPGLLVSIASINQAQMRALYAAGVERDLARLLAFRRDLDGLLRAMRAAVGDGVHMDGAFDKLFSKLRDPRFPLRLLPPYQGASDAAFAQFRAAIQADFPAWVEAPSQGDHADAGA